MRVIRKWTFVFILFAIMTISVSCIKKEAIQAVSYAFFTKGIIHDDKFDVIK